MYTFYSIWLIFKKMLFVCVLKVGLIRFLGKSEIRGWVQLSCLIGVFVVLIRETRKEDEPNKCQERLDSKGRNIVCSSQETNKDPILAS